MRDLISCLRDMEHTPFKRFKVDTLERDLGPADTAQRFFLKVEADQRPGLVMQ